MLREFLQDCSEMRSETAVPQRAEGCKVAQYRFGRSRDPGIQDIVEVPFAAVEMKRSAIHFNLDQEGDNVVAQVLHRVAAIIALGCGRMMTQRLWLGTLKRQLCWGVPCANWANWGQDGDAHRGFCCSRARACRLFALKMVWVCMRRQLKPSALARICSALAPSFCQGGVCVLHSRLVPMEKCWAAISILQNAETSWSTWLWSFIYPSPAPSRWLAKIQPAMHGGRVPKAVWLLAMEKLQGESLAAPPSTVGAMSPVLALLENLSACAIVHADLRYDNLIQDRNNQLHLIDFDSLVLVSLAPMRDELIRDHRQAQHPLRLPLSQPEIACILHTMWQLAMLDWPNRPSSDGSLPEDIAAYLTLDHRKELQLFQWALALESQSRVELTWDELRRAVQAVEAVPQWGRGL